MRLLCPALFALACAIAACHCDDECRSAAQCPSGICRDGRCVPLDEPDASASPDGGDAG